MLNSPCPALARCICNCIVTFEEVYQVRAVNFAILLTSLMRVLSKVPFRSVLCPISQQQTLVRDGDHLVKGRHLCRNSVCLIVEVHLVHVDVTLERISSNRACECHLVSVILEFIAAHPGVLA